MKSSDYEPALEQSCFLRRSFRSTPRSNAAHAGRKGKRKRHSVTREKEEKEQRAWHWQVQTYVLLSQEHDQGKESCRPGKTRSHPGITPLYACAESLMISKITGASAVLQSRIAFMAPP
jgi:hypothetical protein